MDHWDRDTIDLLAPAFVEFRPDGTGAFRFIAVEGWMDCRHLQHAEHPSVEFTWEGNDEDDPVSGRGWARKESDGSLAGHIFFHMGDDSAFRAAGTKNVS